jgi:hypothetical protein
MEIWQQLILRPLENPDAHFLLVLASVVVSGAIASGYAAVCKSVNR